MRKEKEEDEEEEEAKTCSKKWTKNGGCVSRGDGENATIGRGIS